MKRMIKKILLVMVILLDVTYIAFSQPDTDAGIKETGLTLGLSAINLEDKALNTVLHKGIGLVGICYVERSDTRSVKLFDLKVASGFLKSDFESKTATYRFTGSGRFRWLHNFSKTISGLYFYLGGNGEVQAGIEYFDNWDESHFYWMNAYSAGIDFRLDYLFGTSRRIRIEGDMPVFSFVSRPPAEFFYTQSSPSLKDILGDLNSDLRIMSPPNYLDLNLQVKYTYGKTKKIMPSIFWRLDYLNIEMSGSSDLKYIDQTIGVEYIF